MKDKKKTLDKKCENFKLKKILKRQKLKEKGITLIALVVTIIILLILAGVTLNIALSDNGLFNKAKKAADDYKEAQDREAEEIDKLDYTFQDTQDELAGKVVPNGKYSEKNKVNMPKLAHTGLTAVKFNGVATVALGEDDSNTVQNVSDEEIQKDNWYNYSKDGNSQWANAKTEDGSMWVWIPRFAYNIKYNNTANKSEKGTIDIVFLKGTTDEPAPTTSEGKDSSTITIKRASEVLDEGIDWTQEDNENVYVVHPAFTNESSIDYANGGWDKEISGFWMAKFEAGYVGTPDEQGAKEAKDSPIKYSSIKSLVNTDIEEVDTIYYGDKVKRKANETAIKWPTFQANRPSMNYISISDAYELCKAINTAGNPYGLNSSNVDGHLTKNSEWGAVAYLSYSKYGRNCTEVTNNSANPNGSNTIYAVTGYANDTNGEAKDLTTLVNGQEVGNWKTSNGQKASTTGNIYGIYDMSGGVWEFTSGYLAKGEYFDSYAGKLKIENSGNSSKYKSIYAYSNSEESNVNNYNEENNNKRLGEAIWETSTRGSGTSSWNSEISGFVSSTSPFSIRGGRVGSSGNGLFSFNTNVGCSGQYCRI